MNTEKGKKVFISQPMRFRSNDELRKEREKIKEKIESYGYIVVDSIFDELNDSEVKHISLAYLAKSIYLLSTCDYIYLMDGWEEARGCLFEDWCARQYEIPILTF